MHPSTFALFFPVNVKLMDMLEYQAPPTLSYKDASYHKQDLWVRFPSPRPDNETSQESQRHEDELVSWRHLKLTHKRIVILACLTNALTMLNRIGALGKS